MGKNGWTIVGLAVSFVIIQSCGEPLGTGKISTPGAMPEQPPQQEQPATVTPPMMTSYLLEDGGWPDFEYDEGQVFWDGGAAVPLGEWHWNQGISNHRGENGQRYQVSCIAMGSEFAVWGSNPFTDDSPICTAAAQQGLISRATGGDVTIEIRPAQRSYLGMDANGVSSFSWGPYPGSYVVLKP